MTVPPPVPPLAGLTPEIVESSAASYVYAAAAVWDTERTVTTTSQLLSAAKEYKQIQHLHQFQTNQSKKIKIENVIYKYMLKAHKTWEKDK